MNDLRLCPLPPDALLARYEGEGGYTDCYTAALPAAVSHAAFVEAFYTTAVFKVERLLLGLLVAKPSTDAEAKQLAAGQRETFSAWRVEARATNQLLLCEFSGRTRSWLMVEPAESGSGTQLYFGSAVLPATPASGGSPRLGFVFTALLGFHKLYSRVLLSSACARLTAATRRV